MIVVLGVVVVVVVVIVVVVAVEVVVLWRSINVIYMPSLILYCMG